MKSKFIKPLIGILCVLALLAAAAVAVYLDSQSPDPILGIFRDEESSDPEEDTSTTVTSPTESQTPTEDAPVAPPADLPSSVVIPTEKDPATGESLGISFPCQVPNYGLTIEKLAPYNGMFVEDGTNRPTEGVAMLMIKNDGDFPIEYTQINVQYGDQNLLFDISALPVGETLVVQEKTGKTVPQGTATAATALVVQRARMDMSEDKIQVVDNGDNTLTIRNLTEETIPTVRVFYKHYMQNEDLFVGGIAFTVRITRLGANESITIQPAHYTSQTSRVVMALTYNDEV